jgi:hypothetical protein
MAAACFPGCVQLLANIFSLKPAGGSSSSSNGGGGANDDGDGGGGDCCTAAKGLASWAAGDSANAVAGSSSSSGVAAAVLSNVCGALLSLGEGAPDVDVAVGPAAATAMGIGTDTAAVAAAAPADVSRRRRRSSSSSKSQIASPEFPPVSLQCFEPACLTAGKQHQQMTLTLQLPGLQGGDASRDFEFDGATCRLVAFQDGAAVIDQEVTLTSNSIR